MKTQAKYTPGPWRLIEGAIIAPEKTSRNSFIVVELPSRDPLNEPRDHAIGIDDKANGILIAAAPEMLEALESIVYLNQYHAEAPFAPDVLKIALTAIAKAKGE